MLSAWDEGVALLEVAGQRLCGGRMQRELAGLAELAWDQQQPIAAIEVIVVEGDGLTDTQACDRQQPDQRVEGGRQPRRLGLAIGVAPIIFATGGLVAPGSRGRTRRQGGPYLVVKPWSHQAGERHIAADVGSACWESGGGGPGVGVDVVGEVVPGSVELVVGVLHR